MAASRKRTSCLVALALVCALAGRAPAQGIGSHVGGGVLAGDAAGLDDGYQYFGGFVPLTQPGGDSLLFADGNLQLYNEGSDYVGGAVGVGVRSLSGWGHSILGANVYVDRRDMGLAEFNQIGFGLESLGERLDVRLNLTVPVGPATRDDYRGTGFMGGSIGRSYDRYAAFKTLDAEVGSLLYSRNQEQLRAFVGAYSLFHDQVDDAAGVRGRVEARFSDQLFLGGFVESDGEFGTTGGVTFDIRFGRGSSASDDSEQALLARLGDPVQRRRHVVVARRDHTEYFTLGGSQINVQQVTDLASLSGPGLGGASLTPQAEVTASAADIVYVHGGVYEGRSITLSQDGQKLLAGTTDHTVHTDQGSIFLPATGEVVLRNAPGDAIVIAADNVAVIGFTIENPGRDGINASAAPTGAGIVIAENTITGAGRHGVYIDKPTHGEFRDNVISDSFDHGVVLASFNGHLLRNTVTGSGGIGATVQGDLNGNVTGNTFEENALGGLAIYGDLNGGLVENTASYNYHGSGIGVVGSVAGDLLGNVTERNYSYNGSGIAVGGDVGGRIEANESFRNGLNGIHVAGDVNGRVYENKLNENDSGLVVAGTVGGDISRNLFLGNTLHGAYVGGDVRGAVTENRAVGNSYGIGVGGSVAGGVIDNFASGNRVSAQSSYSYSNSNITYVGNLGIDPYFSSDLVDDDGDGELGSIDLFASNLTVSSTSGYGISVEGEGVVYRGNVTNGNDVGAILWNPLLVEENQVNENKSDGLRVRGGLSGVITANTANNNGGDGIDILTYPYDSSAPMREVYGNTTADNTSSGIRVYSANVTLRENTATGNSYGIYIEGNSHVDVRGNVATGNSYGIRTYYTSGDIDSNIVDGNSSYGIYANSLAGDISGNLASGNGHVGIYASGHSSGDVSDNTANDNGSHGIYLNSPYSSNSSSRYATRGDVTGNTTNGNQGSGVYTYGRVDGQVTGNTAIGNSESGFYLRSRDHRYSAVLESVVGNTATDNGSGGFYVYGGVGGSIRSNAANENTGDGLYVYGVVAGDISGNTADGNAQSGVYVRASNHPYDAVLGDVVGNSANDNQANGIYLEGTSRGAVLGNVASNNGLDGVRVYGATYGDVASNTAIGNGGSGIRLTSRYGNDAVLGNVSNNTSHENQGTGVYIVGAAEGSITSNATNRNGVDGIYASQGAAGDVTGNTVIENGDDGIDLNGSVGGVISDNAWYNNGDLNLER